VAQAWGCFPWEVDAAPLQEVLLKLKLMGMAAEARAYWDAKQRRARK